MAESEPAKSIWPAMNCVRPSPEPLGLYATLTVLPFSWHTEM